MSIKRKIVKVVARFFFNEKYLKGRHFESSSKGWRWVLRSIWFQKIFGFNKQVPWPVSPFIQIKHPENIEFDIDDLNNFQTFGCYFQAAGKIHIGKGTYIAPNVGIITSNHDPDNLERNLPPEDVYLGSNCWIGMNSVILPGVCLGSHTIVGAGSIVTKSFPEGNLVIAGVPAKVIKQLNI